MKLLVIGGSSFIAKNFLEQNDFRNIDVTSTYWSDDSFPSFIKKLNKNIKTARYDLLTYKKDFSDYDTCIYFAGNANHNWSLTHKREDLFLNTVGLLNCLKTFKGRLIYMSSGAIYYGLRGLVNSDVKVNPTFPYAISKLTSENYVRAAFEQGEISGFTCIRFYYAFGPYEPKRRLIPRLFEQFINKGKEEFAINGHGETLMQPTFVFDTAKALYKIIAKDRGNLVIDLCSQKPIKLRDLIKEVANVCRVELKLKTIRTTEKKIEFYSSPNEFNKLFGFKEEFSLRKGLLSYLRWWRDANG